MILSLFGGGLAPHDVANLANAIPVKEIDGQTINFDFTDNNDGEDILIYTDSGNYRSLSEFTVRTSIINTSDRGQNVGIQGYFGKSGLHIKSISKITDVVTPHMVEVNNYTRTCRDINPPMRAKDCNDVLTGSREEIRYTNERQNLRLEAGKSGPVHAKPSEGIRRGGSSVFIPSGGTVYLDIVLEIPRNAKVSSFEPEEFFFEAIGDEGSYGHLDPTVTFASAGVFTSTANIGTQAITVPGGATLFVIGIGFWESANYACGTTPTLNAVSMKLAVDNDNSATAGDQSCLWYLENPSTGDFAWDWAGTSVVDEGMVFSYAFYSGNNTTEAKGTSGGQQQTDGSCTAGTLTGISSGDGIVAVGGGFYNSSPGTITWSNVTTVTGTRANSGNKSSELADNLGASGDTAVSHTFSADADPWCYIGAMVIEQAEEEGTPGPPTGTGNKVFINGARVIINGSKVIIQ